MWVSHPIKGDIYENPKAISHLFPVCLSFLPCGMIFGYTICAFVAERNLNAGLVYYGPLILGACWALVTALTMLAVKLVKKCIIYWQPWLLLAAGVFNLIASCFYFADGFGEYIWYLCILLDTFIAPIIRVMNIRYLSKCF